MARTGTAFAAAPPRACLVALFTAAALAPAIPRPTVLAQAPLPTLDVGAGGRVVYYIADGEPGSGFTATDRELAAWALDSWARATGGRIRFEPGAEADALVRVYWVGADGGQYGEMRSLLVGGRRGAAVFIRPDMDGLGPQIAGRARQDRLWRDAIVYLTCVHELGHAVGLAHTADFADIMYSFQYGGDIPAYFARYRDRLRTRADIATTSALSESDAARVRRLYPSP